MWLTYPPVKYLSIGNPSGFLLRNLRVAELSAFVFEAHTNARGKCAIRIQAAIVFGNDANDVIVTRGKAHACGAQLKPRVVVNRLEIAGH